MYLKSEGAKHGNATLNQKIMKYSTMGDLIALSKMHSLCKINFNIVNSDDRTPLHLAAFNGHVMIVRYLIENGAEINSIDRWGGTPLDDALREGLDPIIDYLRSKDARSGNQTEEENIIRYASLGDLKGLQKLIHQDYHINVTDYNERSPLHLSASNGHLNMVKYLIEKE
jgi:ankyrin repeat protein